MVFKVEDGTGVPGANALATEAFVTAYLADRGRSEENGWDDAISSERETAIVRATDYIEQRWGDRFLGTKKYLDLSVARATLTLTGQPTDGQTVTIDAVTYTFNASLGAAYSVLIGASIAKSLTNLFNAIMATAAEAGITHGAGTAAHYSATASEEIGDTLVVEALEKGTPGNDIAVSTTITSGSWSSTTLTGGGDVPVPQPLSFPRANLFSREGVLVQGVPPKVQAAVAEYAVRAHAATLLPDPTVDDTGRAVARKLEKVGPIEEEIEYEAGSGISRLLRPYPAADRLLMEYISVGGRIMRG